MDIRFKSLKERYKGSNLDDEFTLPDNRQNSGIMRFWRSVSNGSVLFYPIILVIVFVSWYLIKKGYIS